MASQRVFRGKTKNGEWVKGWYIKTDFAHYIVPAKYTVNWKVFIKVIPQTVGQSTGRFDKHNDEIFEGMQVKIGGPIFTVKWSKGFCAWRLDDWASLATYNKNAIEIIHDNPEILK